MENIIIRGTNLTEYEARIKLLVLNYSLSFESLASDFLSRILTLDRTSKSLGNTNQALSMEQKVALMLDTNFFNSERDKKFIAQFQSIRNQFMHNANVKSFESCLLYLDGAEKFLERVYLEKKRALEKAGGEKAAKDKADEKINDMELQCFDINEKEKLLYNANQGLKN